MYAIVDIETTSGSPKSGKITEIAIYIYNGQEIIDSFVSLVNPECYIPPYITNITGISDQMVANAPRFYEIAKRVVEITSNKIFVAHNVRFDYNFIRKEFDELGYRFNRKTLCTVELSRKYLPGHQSYSLGKLCGDLGIGINGRHRAAGDARATVDLFELILRQHILKDNGLF